MLKYGLVGAGYWGKNLIRNFMNSKECELSIVCDNDKTKLEEFIRSIAMKLPLVKNTFKWKHFFFSYIGIINQNFTAKSNFFRKIFHNINYCNYRCCDLRGSFGHDDYYKLQS